MQRSTLSVDVFEEVQQGRNRKHVGIYVKCPSMLSDGGKKSNIRHILVELTIRNLVKIRYNGCRV